MELLQVIFSAVPFFLFTKGGLRVLTNLILIEQGHPSPLNYLNMLFSIYGGIVQTHCNLALSQGCQPLNVLGW